MKRTMNALISYEHMLTLPLDKLQEAWTSLMEEYINSHDEWDHEYARKFRQATCPHEEKVTDPDDGIICGDCRLPCAP